MKFNAGVDRVTYDGVFVKIQMAASLREQIEIALAVQKPEIHKLVWWIEKKQRPRTTGWKSQSNHLHGHLSQIAEHLGYYMSEIKEVMKEDIPSWPRKEIYIGNTRKVIYMSESAADTKLESTAIEWCHVRAGEMGLLLEEGDKDDRVG